MYELIQLSENDYYIDCPAKIGIVKVGDGEGKNALPRGRK